MTNNSFIIPFKTIHLSSNILDNCNVGEKSHGNGKPRMLRRSSRIKLIEENDKKTTMSTKQNKRRRRYNSVMDDVNEDEHDESVDVNGSVEVEVEMQEQRRREPEHRHLNRMRLQRENVCDKL